MSLVLFPLHWSYTIRPRVLALVGALGAIRWMSEGTGKYPQLPSSNQFSCHCNSQLTSFDLITHTTQSHFLPADIFLNGLLVLVSFLNDDNT